MKSALKISKIRGENLDFDKNRKNTLQKFNEIGNRFSMTDENPEYIKIIKERLNIKITDNMEYIADNI